LILALGMVGGAFAQGSLDDSNAFCLERLEVPMYPPLAAKARLSGSLATIVALGQKGSVEAVSYEEDAGSATAKKLFFRAIEDSIRASTFLPTCRGRTVKLFFEFKLGTQRTPRVSFAYPSRFLIFAPADVVEPAQ